MEVLLISLALSTLSLTALGLYAMSVKAQENMDVSRKSYTLVYPAGTTDKQIHSFLRSIGTSLVPNASDKGATPTLVFEVRWTPKGVRHVLRVTPQDDAHVKLMLDAHLPGITYDLADTEDEKLDINPVFAVNVQMSDCSRLLTMSTTKGQSLVDDVANGILHSVPSVNEGEVVAYQVIVSHTDNLAHPPQKVVRSLIHGKVELSPEDLKEINQKRAEHNFNVTMRIGVQAGSEIRGRELAGGIIRTIRQINNERVQLNGAIVRGHLRDLFTYALTSKKRTAQLTVTELSGLMASPIGDPQVPGLTQGAARRIPATEAIPSSGDWVLGNSDVHGRERPIALEKEGIVRHAIVIGAPGTGKTTFLANGVTQLAAAGLGIVVVDAGKDLTAERLYYRALDGMPRSRMNDVICINPNQDASHPVSINLLDQGLGTEAINMIVGVFESLYPDIAKGVSVRELIHHGLWTLIEAGGYSVIDLPTLFSPRNATEDQWARSLIKGVKDPELKDFWERNPGASEPLNSKSKDRDSWNKYTEPIMRRLWQLTSRPDIRFMFGQTHSTINVAEALRENKILLFSVGGMDDEQAAQLAASMFTTLVWQVAQQLKPAPQLPNVLFADEFQVSTRIQGGLSDMLARGRALKLGVVLATQFITRESIPQELRSSAVNQPATRIVFNSGSKEADVWSREFGRLTVTENDITRLAKYHGVAQVVNGDGNRSPVTFKALRPAPETGISKQIVALSRQRHGRDADLVRREIVERRRAVPSTRPVSREPKSDRPNGEERLDNFFTDNE